MVFSWIWLSNSILWLKLHIKSETIFFYHSFPENDGPVKKSSLPQGKKFHWPKHDNTGAMPGNSRKRQEKDDTLINFEGVDSKLIDEAPVKNNPGM